MTKRRNQMNFSGNAVGQLCALVKRIQDIEDKIDILNDDKKHVYAEAKAMGLDKAIMRKVLRRLAKDTSEVEEDDVLMDLYESAVRGVREIDAD